MYLSDKELSSNSLPKCLQSLGLGQEPERVSRYLAHEAEPNYFRDVYCSPGSASVVRWHQVWNSGTPMWDRKVSPTKINPHSLTWKLSQCGHCPAVKILLRSIYLILECLVRVPAFLLSIYHPEKVHCGSSR